MTPADERQFEADFRRDVVNLLVSTLKTGTWVDEETGDIQVDRMLNDVCHVLDMPLADIEKLIAEAEDRFYNAC